MPLTLSCAGSAILQSAYFVIWLTRKNIVTGDLPPIMWGNLPTGSVTTLDGGIANWTGTPAAPSPTHGTWNATTTYTVGDTVASLDYPIQSADGTSFNQPLVYRCIDPGNLGHRPEAFDGRWTCTTTPPFATNSDYKQVPFGYALSPLPTKSVLAATQWNGGLGHSLAWTVTAPGDVVQFIDLWVALNYLVGGQIIKILSRPLTASATTGTQGLIVHPGVNAQFQCWHTSGLSDTPWLTLSNFDPVMVDGMQPGVTVGNNYLSSLVASGGTPPYAYAITSGSLPPGVTLDGTTGVISGKPTDSGIYDFTAQVTDSTGATATVTCAVPVECAGAALGNSFY